MNIFKVFASGKKPMLEEQMTSVLAWLLHPQMEHGLGHEFLSRFIGSISTECPELAETAENLRNRLRGEAVSDFGMELEENLSTAVVDMIVTIDDWKIALESKINPSAASDVQQLNKEYSGLIESYNDKVCVLVFLVPIDGKGELPSQVQKVYDSFDQKQIRPNDFFKLMTWQENSSDHPSIISLLKALLQDEADGKTEPISDYTRHTIKALIKFIHGNFLGYDRERKIKQNAVYPYIKTSEILNKTSGIVGTKWGMTGFIRLSANDLKGAEYQYSDSDKPHNSNWISVGDFKQIYNWKVSGTPPVIKWNKKKLDAEILYNIVSACPLQSLYIGIQGGLSALESMELELIKDSAWQISAAEEPPSYNWIKGGDFRQILESKGMANK